MTDTPSPSTMIAGAAVERRLLITNARIVDHDEPVDIELRDGAIHEVRSGKFADRGSDPVDLLDADGALVVRGLHDHHIHLVALAAAAASVDCGPPHDGSTFAAGLRAAARAAADGWVRGISYYESVAGELDRRVLDAIVGDVPVRILHRSGTVWFCNTAALTQLGVLWDGGPDGIERDELGVATGRLFRVDDWMRTRVPLRVPDVVGTAASLLRLGVTEFTDATPAGPMDTLLLDAVAHGRIRQRVHTMVAPGNPGTAGQRPAAVKLLLDERDPPDFDILCAQIAEAHDGDLPVAIHLTDRSTTWLALAAWEHAGVRPRDRIEHGAVLDIDALDRLRASGLTVVTNPSLAARRGDDHARDTDPDDVAHLWRCASLIEAGIPVRGGTDAPYGPANPWLAMADAVHRRSPSGCRIGSDRPATPDEAFALFSDTPKLAVGQRADLAVLTATSLAAAIDDGGVVDATIIGGELVWTGRD